MLGWITISSYIVDGRGKHLTIIQAKQCEKVSTSLAFILIHFLLDQCEKMSTLLAFILIHFLLDLSENWKMSLVYHDS